MAAVVQTGKAWIANYAAKSLEKVICWNEATHDDDETPLSQSPHKPSSQNIAADTQSSTECNNTKKPFYIEDNNIRVPCYNLDFAASVQLIRFTRTEPPVRAILSDSVSTVEAILSEEVCDRFVEKRGRHVSDGTTGGVAYLQSFEIVISTLHSASSCLTLLVKDLNFRGSSGSPVFGKPKPVQGDSRVKIYLEQLNGQDSDLESASNVSEPEELTEIATQKPRRRSYPRAKVKNAKSGGRSDSNLNKSLQAVNKPKKYHDDRPAVFNPDELAPMPTNMFMGHLNGLEPVVPQGRRYMDSNVVADRLQQSKRLMSLLDTKHDSNDKPFAETPFETRPIESKLEPTHTSKAIQAEKAPSASQHIKGNTLSEAENTAIASQAPQVIAEEGLLSEAEPAWKKFHQDPILKEQPGTPSLRSSESSSMSKLKTSANLDRLQVDSYMHQGHFTFAKYITPSHAFCKAQNIALKQADSLAHPDPGARFSTYSVPPDVLKNLSIIVEERAAALETNSANRQKESNKLSQQELPAISVPGTFQYQSEFESESEEESPLPWSSTPARETTPMINVLPPDSSDPVCGQVSAVRSSRPSTRSPSGLRVRSSPAPSVDLSYQNQLETHITSSPPEPAHGNRQLPDPEHSDAMEEEDLAVEAPHALGDLPLSMRVPMNSTNDFLTFPNSKLVADADSTTVSSQTAAKTPHTPPKLGKLDTVIHQKTPSSYPKTLIPGTFRPEISSARSNRIAVDGGFDSDPADISDQIQQQFEEDQTRASGRVGRGGKSVDIYKHIEETKDDLGKKTSDVASPCQELQTVDPPKRKLVLSPKSTNVTMKRPKLDLMTQVDYEIEDPSVTARKNRRKHFEQSSNGQRTESGDPERTTLAEDFYQPTLQDVAVSNIEERPYPSIEQSHDAAGVTHQDQISQRFTLHKPHVHEQIQNFRDVFENFCLAYPEYGGTLLDFVEFCFWLHREITGFRRYYPIFVWDDMTVRFKDEYHTYCEEQESYGVHPVEFAEFYANEISQPVHCKGIINKSTLDIIMGIHNGSHWDLAKQEYSLDPRSEAKRDLDFHEQYLARVNRQTPRISKQDNQSRTVSSSAMSRTGSNQSAASSESTQNAQRPDLLRDMMSASPMIVPRNGEHRHGPIRQTLPAESSASQQKSRRRSVSFAPVDASESHQATAALMYHDSTSLGSVDPADTLLSATSVVDSDPSSTTSPLDVADLDVSQTSLRHSYPTPRWNYGTEMNDSITEEPKERTGKQRQAVETGTKQFEASKTDAQLVEKRNWFRETDSPFETFAKGYGALKSINGVLGDPAGDDDHGMVLKKNDMHRGVGILDWSV